MKHIYQIYKFVLYIDQDIKYATTNHPEIANIEGYFTKPKIKQLIARYAKQNKLRFNDALQVAESAADNGYIYIDKDNTLNNDEVVVITYGKGQSLIEGPKYLPYGLINAIAKEYQNTFVIFTAMLSLVISIIALRY